MDAIRGWLPPGGDDEDVNVYPDMRFMSIRAFPSSFTLSPICPSLEPTGPKTCPPQPDSVSFTPSTGFPCCPVATSSDRRAQRNRSRDPSWIPRPRNAFIIFRCEYSREHAQGSQEPQRDQDATNPSAKTLSKRAADAWKELPLSERDRYKALAEMEREEHARVYPNYRFRPVKRHASETRKKSCERSQGPAAMASVERRPAPSARSPSVSLRRSCSGLSVERGETPIPRITAPLPELPSCLFDPLADVPFTVDVHDPALFYPSPEATLPPSLSPPSSIESYSPLCAPTAGVAPDMFHRHDSAFSLDLTHDDLEREALEAYAIGLYNYDLLSPFVFPE